MKIIPDVIGQQQIEDLIESMYSIFIKVFFCGLGIGFGNFGYDV